jgi:hypothetical protein
VDAGALQVQHLRIGGGFSGTRLDGIGERLVDHSKLLLLARGSSLERPSSRMNEQQAGERPAAFPQARHRGAVRDRGI